jgi:membrane protein DedA with SNARE-associated domain
VGEWIQQLIDQLGYVGIAILMFAETVFPPLPSEVIMPLAGLRAARGSLSLAGAVAAGSAGAMAGNLCWYFAARSRDRSAFTGFVGCSSAMGDGWHSIGRRSSVRGTG